MQEVTQQDYKKVLSHLAFKGKVMLDGPNLLPNFNKILVLGTDKTIRLADPKDLATVFDTLAEMNIYLNNPSRYSGQIAICKEFPGHIYILNDSLDAWMLAAKEGDPGPKGDKPDHNWSSTSLRFQKPDGSWGSFVKLQGPEGPPGLDGQDYSAFGSSFTSEGTVSSNSPTLVEILPDSVRLNPGFYAVSTSMHFSGVYNQHRFTLFRKLQFSLYVSSDESGNINMVSDLFVNEHSGVHVIMNELTNPPEPSEINNLPENVISFLLDTDNPESKVFLSTVHGLHISTGYHFSVDYTLQSLFHKMLITEVVNLLLNSYFQNWIHQGAPEVWLSEHNNREQSTDSLEGDYSMRIAHNFAYTGGRFDEQPFTDHNASGVPTQYEAEIWVKGAAKIRIGILRPGYTVHDYGPWIEFQTYQWEKITHTSTKDNRLGSNGNFRIQHQRGDSNPVDFKVDKTVLKPTYQS